MTRGRKRHTGARYPGGKLKPAGPNERVVAARMALLAPAETGKGARVDISKAENALDVALARRWITEERHRAARKYATLWLRHTRRVLGRLPEMKVSQALTSQANVLATDEGLLSAGVRTEADAELAKAIAEFEAGRIDQRALGKAERAHRAARINWARLAPKDVAAIFWAALDLENFRPTPTSEDEAADADRAALERIWSGLSAADVRELFAVCVLDSWPQWVIWRAAGKDVPQTWDSKRLSLERALDAVIAETAKLGRRPLQPRSDPVSFSEASARKTGPIREEVIDYVTATGEPLYTVVRRSRGIAR